MCTIRSNRKTKKRKNYELFMSFAIQCLIIKFSKSFEKIEKIFSVDFVKNLGIEFVNIAPDSTSLLLINQKYTETNSGRLRMLGTVTYQPQSMSCLYLYSEISTDPTQLQEDSNCGFNFIMKNHAVLYFGLSNDYPFGVFTEENSNKLHLINLKPTVPMNFDARNVIPHSLSLSSTFIRKFSAYPKSKKLAVITSSNSAGIVELNGNPDISIFESMINLFQIKYDLNTIADSIDILATITPNALVLIKKSSNLIHLCYYDLRKLDGIPITCTEEFSEVPLIKLMNSQRSSQENTVMIYFELTRRLIIWDYVLNLKKIDKIINEADGYPVTINDIAPFYNSNDLFLFAASGDGQDEFLIQRISSKDIPIKDSLGGRIGYRVAMSNDGKRIAAIEAHRNTDSSETLYFVKSVNLFVKRETTTGEVDIYKSDNKDYSCPAIQVLDNNVCTDSCSSGLFPHLKEICLGCKVDFCQNCGSNIEECTTCKTNFRLNGKTSCICNNGYYFDQNQCHKCHTSCGACDGPDNTDCISCSGALLLAQGQCLAECPIGFCQINTTECQPNNGFPNCKVCESSASAKCTDCHTGFSLSGGLCNKNCDINEFYERGACLNCNLAYKGCKDCVDRNSGCKVCENSMNVINKFCENACGDGMYEIAGSCHTCDTTCATCLGNSNEDCLKCDTSHYFVEIISPKGKCLNCHPGCTTGCSGPLCADCPGKNLVEEGLCVESCSPEKVETSGVCASCPKGKYKKLESCYQCSDYGSNCVECGRSKCHKCSNYYYIENGQCVQNCNDSHYETTNDGVDVCLPCDSNCKACLNQADYCTGCQAGEYLSGLNKCEKCTENCLRCKVGGIPCIECEKDFWVKEGKCEKCDQSCLECFKEEGFETCGFENLNILELKNSDFGSVNKTATFEFAKELSNFDIEDFKQKINFKFFDEKTPNVDFEIKNITIKNAKLEIELTFKEENYQTKTATFRLENTYMMIKSKERNSSTKREFYYFKNTLEIKNITVKKPETSQEKGVKILAQSETSTKTSTKSFSLATYLVTNSLGTIGLKLLQTFDILRFINIDYPKIFGKFLEIFSENFLDFIPNYVHFDETRDNDEDNKVYCKSLEEKIKENETECFLINNTGNILIQISTVLILWGIFSWVKKNFLKESKFFGFINFSFTMKFFIAVQLDILVAVFINLRNFWVTPFLVFLNLALSVGFLIFYLKFLVKVFEKSILLEKINSKKSSSFIYEQKIKEENLEKWQFLKEDLKKERKTFGEKHFSDFLIIKDILLPFFVIIFINTPYIQIIFSSIITGLSFFLVFKSKPFSSKSMNIISIINEGFSFIILLMFGVYHIGGDLFKEEKNNLIFGWIFIGMTGVCMLANTLIGVGEVVRTLMSCKKGNKGKKQKDNVNHQADEDSQLRGLNSRAADILNDREPRKGKNKRSHQKRKKNNKKKEKVKEEERTIATETEQGDLVITK